MADCANPTIRLMLWSWPEIVLTTVNLTPYELFPAFRILSKKKHFLKILHGTKYCMADFANPTIRLMLWSWPELVLTTVNLKPYELFSAFAFFDIFRNFDFCGFRKILGWEGLSYCFL